MQYKKYVIEGIGSFLLTMTLLLTNNSIGTSLLWATLILIRNTQPHCYYNVAIGCALYSAKLIRLTELFAFGIAQTAGSLAALIGFKTLTGSAFLPDSIAINTLPILLSTETICALILCLLIVTIHTENKAQNYINQTLHSVIAGSMALVAIQSIGGIVNPSFGYAVLLGSFFEISSTTFGSILKNNFHYSLIYWIVPMAAGLCTYNIKKWLEE